MKKKYSAGAVIALIAGVLALVGAVAYLVNAKTNYYAKMGVDTTIVVCLCAAAILSALRLLVTKPGFADILPVCASVLATLGLMLLVNARVNNLAAVFTFENNAANMADTTSCIVAIAASLLAVIMTVVSAFSDTVKEA